MTFTRRCKFDDFFLNDIVSYRRKPLPAGRENRLRMRGADIIVHSQQRGNDMILVIDNQIDQLRQAHSHCWLWILGTESGKEVSGWTNRLTTKRRRSDL